MSARARAWAWSMALPSPRKLVLVALAEYADDDGEHCWPSAARLVRMTGMARSTVFAALNALEHAGLISRQRGGPKHSTRYRLAIGPGVVREPDPGSPGERLGVVREADPGGPANGPGWSGRRTGVVREADPNRHYNRHSNHDPNDGRGRRDDETDGREQTAPDPVEVVWPPGLSATDRRRAARTVARVAPAARQGVVDVLAASMQDGKARKPLALLAALVRRWAAGTLDTTPGEAIAAARAQPPRPPPVAPPVPEPSTAEVLRRHARMRGENPERYVEQFYRQASGGKPR